MQSKRDKIGLCVITDSFTFQPLAMSGKSQYSPCRNNILGNQVGGKLPITITGFVPQKEISVMAPQQRPKNLFAIRHRKRHLRFPNTHTVYSD